MLKVLVLSRFWNNNWRRFDVAAQEQLPAYKVSAWVAREVSELLDQADGKVDIDVTVRRS